MALIAAFWAAYAVLSVVGRIFDSGPGPRLDWRSGPVVVAMVESFCWALLTPFIFCRAARIGGERAKLGRRIVIFIGMGVATATVFSLGGDALRDLVHQLPPDPRRPPPRPGPPLWFDFVNALVIYTGVLAAGLARAYSSTSSLAALGSLADEAAGGSPPRQRIENGMNGVATGRVHADNNCRPGGESSAKGYGCTSIVTEALVTAFRAVMVVTPAATLVRTAVSPYGDTVATSGSELVQ